MPFNHTKIVSSGQFSRDDLSLILEQAEQMVPIATGEERSTILAGKILATLFYEPSTRTRLSFESAMYRLGGNVISSVGMRFSSLYKGETISDTMKVIESYSDIIAMRHPETGAAQQAADALSIPFLNAGDGPGEHPTQALLDLFTLQKEKKTLDGLTIAFIGDLKYGRTVHSFIQLLLHYDVHFIFLAPDSLQLPEKWITKIETASKKWTRVTSLQEALSDSDVAYVTRVQEERFTNTEEFEKVRMPFCVTTEALEQSQNKNITIMHPLPRVGEIDPDVDSKKGAAYFRQAANGVPLRMALLSLLLN